MSGLESIDITQPAGSASLAQGDNSIRELKSNLKEFAEKEHYLGGEHAIPRGSSAQRPAASKAGRLYILQTSGVADELQYDNGSSWATITKNQDVIGYVSDLATHKAATTIDHPDGSVTYAKIVNGAVYGTKIPAGGIKKGHLDGSADIATSVATLVNGGDADSLHTHTLNESTIEWNSFLGISQILLPTGSYIHTSADTWVTVAYAYLYVPSGANGLEYYGEMHIGALNGNGKMRVRNSGATGSELTSGATSPTVVGPGTLDVASLSGWNKFEIQTAHTSGQNIEVFVDKLTGMFK